LIKEQKFIEKVAVKEEKKERNLQKRFGRNEITVIFATRLKRGRSSLKTSELSRKV
jgi:hypothetical protein